MLDAVGSAVQAIELFIILLEILFDVVSFCRSAPCQSTVENRPICPFYVRPYYFVGSSILRPIVRFVLFRLTILFRPTILFRLIFPVQFSSSYFGLFLYLINTNLN